MTKRIAVILSGCGHLDGAEIREAVLSLLYIDEAGVEASIFAPDIDQHHVVNHITGEEVAGESRNVLQESARIARGDIDVLDNLKASDFAGLVIAGGYGVAKNLSNLAFAGADAAAIDVFKSAVEDFYISKKPIGAICIAPAVISAILRDKGIRLTIGNDAGTASAIEAMGNVHVECATDDIVVDEDNKVVSCSAYMRNDSLASVATGIRKLINKVIELS